MRLIDADALRKAIKTYSDRDGFEYEDGIYITAEDTLDIIDSAPTVNAMAWHNTAKEGLPEEEMRE